jgi:extracellular factor (EF) 3-hydroxypalmitic acid methyl ester biosynthesis protein
MDQELLARQVLGNLTPTDLEILLNLNFRRAFERGELLVAAGENVDRFFLIEDGVLRLDDAPKKEPRFLRPGQVFGSTSFLLERPSTCNVTGVEDGIVLTLNRKDLDWLIEVEAATAARLMRALAAGLSARTVQLPVGAGAQPDTQPQRSHPSRAAQFLTACKDARTALEALGEPPEDGAAFWARERIPAVSTAYRPVLKALSALLGTADPAERPELLSLARHELLHLAGTSRLVERMHTRPEGQPAGYRGFNHVYRNLPEGDDPLGLLTDAWLLTRPWAEAVRERRTIASERVAREVLDRARPDRIVRILSLGCGPARSLGDLLEEPGMAEKVSITCVDDDQEALVHANNLLKGRAPRGDITFRHGNPMDLVPDSEGYGGYDMVASLYTADNADTAALGRILFTAHRWLHAHGVLELVGFGDAVPDWLLLEVLLDWKPVQHTQRELQDVVARSPFHQTRTEVAPTPSGLNLFLRATK